MSVIRSQCKDEAEYLQALRVEFAAAALTGILAGVSDAGVTGILETCDKHGVEPPELHAGMAWNVSDAMIDEMRNHPRTKKE